MTTASPTSAASKEILAGKEPHALEFGIQVSLTVAGETQTHTFAVEPEVITGRVRDTGTDFDNPDSSLPPDETVADYRFGDDSGIIEFGNGARVEAHLLEFETTDINQVRPVEVQFTLLDAPTSEPPGNDIVTGDRGNDTIDGGGGDDTLLGGRGADTIFGGEGDDVIFGGRGNDAIDGGSGNDLIEGGIGSDTIIGGEGDDEMATDGNNSSGDRFVYTSALDGNDIIDEFDNVTGSRGGVHDTVDLDGLFDSLGATFDDAASRREAIEITQGDFDADGAADDSRLTVDGVADFSITFVNPQDPQAAAYGIGNGTGDFDEIVITNPT